MKTALPVIAVAVVAAVGGFYYHAHVKVKDNSLAIRSTNSTSMIISSPAFANERAIPKKYACDGENINPPFKITGVPPQAQSLVLVMDDPDAPAGTWTHWVVWNIPPKAAEIAENSVPAGAVVGRGSGGKNAYAGPCPPSGTHRYYFRLYALPRQLDISNFSNVAALRNAMDGSIIAEAEVMGTYSKDNQ